MCQSIRFRCCLAIYKRYINNTSISCLYIIDIHKENSLRTNFKTTTDVTNFKTTTDWSVISGNVASNCYTSQSTESANGGGCLTVYRPLELTDIYVEI